MTIGQQADHQALHEVFLPNDDLADFREKRLHKRAGSLHFVVDDTNTGIHFGWILMAVRFPGESLSPAKSRFGLPDVLSNLRFQPVERANFSSPAASGKTQIRAPSVKIAAELQQMRFGAQAPGPAGRASGETQYSSRPYERPV